MNKRKLVISLCLATLLMLVIPFVLPTQAQAYTVSSGTCGENLTWTLDDAGTLTISGSGPMDNYYDGRMGIRAPWYGLDVQAVILPEGITTIGNFAFHQVDVQRIAIPNSVTAIGDYAFYECYWLNTVNIGTGVTDIGEYAFSECSGLGWVTIPGNVTSIGAYAFAHSVVTKLIIQDAAVSIGDYAFKSCTYLQQVELGDCVTQIGSHAFDYCIKLSAVTIPGSVGFVGDGAFYDCRAVETLVLEDGIAAIGEQAFYECSALKTVTVPNSVTRIGRGAFQYCYALRSITLPFVGLSNAGTDYAFGAIFGYMLENLTSVTITNTTGLPDSAFSGWSNLTSISLPDGLKSIGDYAFYQCSALSTIALPDSVQRIGEYAFAGSGLTNITIPSNVSTIGNSAFYTCHQLTDAYITNPNRWCWISFGDSYSNPACYAKTMHILDASTGREVTDLTISTTKIPASAFKNFKNLKSVTVSKYTSSIGLGAFAGCTGLESVTIPFVGGSKKTATELPQYPFGHIFGKTNYTGAVEVRQQYYLDSTSSPVYEKYYIPSSLKSVTVTGGEVLYGAFYGCSGLTNINLPDNIQSLRDYAFYGCRALKSITLPAGITDVGDWTFGGCSSLKTVFYKGTPEQKSAMDACLTSAKWHFEVVASQLDGVSVMKCGQCGAYYRLDGTMAPLQKVEITGLPEKTRYVTAEEISLAGISLTGTYSDGTVVSLGAETVESITADLSGPGRKTVTVTVLGATTDFEVLVHDRVDGTGEELHIPETDPGTVTCTQAGLTEGSHCALCGDVLVAQEMSDPLGHDYVAAFAWCEEDHHRSCEVAVSCSRQCGFMAEVPCAVTHNAPHQLKSIHTAVAEYEGKEFTDTLTHDSARVAFLDWNGRWLTGWFYHTGDIVEVPEDPSRVADNTYTYTFAGWDQEVTLCTGDVTYVAVYDATYIEYKVVFNNWDGEVLHTATYHYADTLQAPAAPNKPADNTYTYDFAGWDQELICTGDMVIDPVYVSAYIDYTVTFKDWNDTVLSTETYHYGDEVTEPAVPERAADDTYTYAFTGWDKEVVNCAGNATYTATYKPVYIDYTVIFKNWDGTVLSTETYHYGDKVTEPAVPDRAADDMYTYAFAGWDKEVVNCAGNATYTATYKPVYIDYTVTFKDWDGTVLSSGSYHWGAAVTAPADPNRPADKTSTYTFIGWEPEVVACAGDATYTAQYRESRINGWVQNGDKWNYYENGEMVTGWQTIKGRQYYFGTDGAMCTEWQTIGGKRYYFGTNGIMHTGWLEMDGTWYYFSPKGVMATGWLEYGSVWYYFYYSNGAMYKGFLNHGGHWYYFNDIGRMHTGWAKVEGKWYYMDENGHRITGWLDLDGTWYYFKATGEMVTGWLAYGPVWYYFNPDGDMRTGWLTYGGQHYYFDTAVSNYGRMAVNKWIKDAGKWYYFDGNGYRVTGRKTINGKTYNFDSSGACLNP